jgi:hypothetical protein
MRFSSITSRRFAIEAIGHTYLSAPASAASLVTTQGGSSFLSSKLRLGGRVFHAGCRSHRRQMRKVVGIPVGQLDSTQSLCYVQESVSSSMPCNRRSMLCTTLLDKCRQAIAQFCRELHRTTQDTVTKSLRAILCVLHCVPTCVARELLADKAFALRCRQSSSVSSSVRLKRQRRPQRRLY